MNKMILKLGMLLLVTASSQLALARSEVQNLKCSHENGMNMTLSIENDRYIKLNSVDMHRDHVGNRFLVGVELVSQSANQIDHQNQKIAAYNSAWSFEHYLSPTQYGQTSSLISISQYFVSGTGQRIISVNFTPSAVFYPEESYQLDCTIQN
jgi:hypothetical protein